MKARRGAGRIGTGDPSSGRMGFGQPGVNVDADGEQRAIGIAAGGDDRAIGQIRENQGEITVERCRHDAADDGCAVRQVNDHTLKVGDNMAVGDQRPLADPHRGCRGIMGLDPDDHVAHGANRIGPGAGFRDRRRARGDEAETRDGGDPTPGLAPNLGLGALSRRAP